jgi:spore coat polysaccharide biosynthesis protein SpsF
MACAGPLIHRRSMRVIAIVQARMGSTRLPGKVLRQLGGRSVLSWVIHRVRQFRRIDGLLIATTVEPADDAVVKEAERCSAEVFRGNESDVLDRYYRGARHAQADVIVRITSDCPLIDPELSDYTIQRFLEEQPDYASNALERTYPRGLDTEVMMFPALERAWQEASELYQRAHVTPYLYQNPDKFRLLSVKGDIDLSGYRWTLDTPEDAEFLGGIYERLGGAVDFTWQDVLRLVEREPALAEINLHIRQKALHEG